MPVSNALYAMCRQRCGHIVEYNVVQGDLLLKIAVLVGILKLDLKDCILSHQGFFLMKLSQKTKLNESISNDRSKIQ